MFFVTLKRHISREPVILEQQMSPFEKLFSFIRTFIHGYREGFSDHGKLNTWLDISSKYIEEFYVIVFVAGVYFQKD